MKALRVYSQAIRILTLVCTVVAVSAASMAQEKVDVTEITPTLLVFATSSGNVVASVGDRKSVV